MFNHEPPGYTCPFCTLIGGGNNEYNRQVDIVYQNQHATAFISPIWWKNNHGHVIVFPNQHHENIYDTPDEALGEVYKVVKKVAIAIRETYGGVGGTSTIQHNEPAGDQDQWHFHVHVFPRYEGNKLYENAENRRFAGPAERDAYAEKLRAYFANKRG